MIKKYVVVLTVLITEDLKPKHVVGKRVSLGMFKYLMLIVTSHLLNLIFVWNIIIAEILMVNQQFGATQQMQLKDGNTVTQLVLHQISCLSQ